MSSDLLRLADGRPVSIHSVDIQPSLNGILGGSADGIWEHVVDRSRYPMDRDPNRDPRGSIPPAYVIKPPPPTRGPLPLWRVAVELRGERFDTEVDEDYWFIVEFHRMMNLRFDVYSSVVLVFFCDDLSGVPLTELIARRVARMDEELWRLHAI